MVSTTGKTRGETRNVATEWTWEEVAHQDSLTEGPAWDGERLLYSHCDANLTWAYDPASGESEVWRRDTQGSNGMVFDRDGRLLPTARWSAWSPMATRARR
jgi:gluconolactonase